MLRHHSSDFGQLNKGSFEIFLFNNIFSSHKCFIIHIYIFDPYILILLGINKVVFPKFILPSLFQTRILSKLFNFWKGGFLWTLQEFICKLLCNDDNFPEVIKIIKKENKYENNTKQWSFLCTAVLHYCFLISLEGEDINCMCLKISCLLWAGEFELDNTCKNAWNMNLK